MAQAKTIQLLRSSRLYVPSGEGATAKTALENAKAALTALTGRKDGEIVLARYQETEGSIKSVLGIYHTSPDLGNGQGTGGSDVTYTGGWTFIQDVTSSVEGLDALQREVDAVETGAGLNENGTYKQTEDEKALEIIGVQGQAANSLMSAIEKIAHAVGDADSSLATDTSKVVTGYTQVNAKITQADTTDVVNLTLTGYTEGADSSGKIAATDTLGSALGKLQGQINGMDLTAVTAEGEVITSVSQTDGKVSASKTPIKDVKLTGYVKGSETGDIAATDDVEGALSKLENRIAKNTVSSSDKTVNINTTGATTDLSVNVDGTTLVKDATNGTISSALKVIKVIPEGTAGTDDVIDANLGTNIQEAYRLVYGNSTTAIGKQINIYKDSALKEVYLGTQNDTVNPSTGEVTKQDSDDPQSLNFVYHLTDNTYSITKVDVSKFLSESEFADGLQVANHVVSVKIDADSEKDSQDTPVNFLSVSSNGVKVSGIKAEIDRKIAALDVTDTAVAGQYVSTVNETDGKVAMTRANVSEAVLNNYEKSQTAPSVLDIAATDTINQAFNKLEHKIADGVASLDADVTSSDGKNVQVKVTEVDGKITAVNVTDSSINATDLDNKIAGLDGTAIATAASGNVYAVLTGVTETDGIISKTSEVTLAAVAKTGAAADVSITDSGNKLKATNVEDALAEIVDKANESLQSISAGNNAITVGTEDANHNQTVGLAISDNSAKQANGTTGMLTIESDGLSLSNVWDCGTF